MAVAAVAVRPLGLLDAIVRVTPPRSIAPQLSTGGTYQPCTLRLPPDTFIPLTRCPESSDTSGLQTVVNALAREARRTPDSAESGHALGLLEMLWPAKREKSADPSIWTLEDAARRPDASAATYADLAAAYLVRAQQTQDPRFILEAMVAAMQAVESDPQSRAGRFNLALALDWYGLNASATDAWRDYLKLDSTSGWANEARERIRALRPISPPVLPAATAPAAEITAFARRFPQEARVGGWNEVLGRWGSAVLRGDTAAARTNLRLAQALGAALEAQGGDATLADAVRAIRAQAANAANTRTLAEGHVEYAKGQALYAAVKTASAKPCFNTVLTLTPASPPLLYWARVFRAITQEREKAPQGKRDMREMQTQIDSLRYPALAARSRWVIATLSLRDGGYEEAIDYALQAAGLLRRIGEHELMGGALYVAADAQSQAGSTPAAHEAVHQTLSVLRGYNKSVWRLNTLATATRMAESDGLPRLALRFSDERTQQAPNPVRKAEAWILRGRILATVGRAEAARANVDSAASVVDSLDDSTTRNWLHSRIQFTQATLAVPTDPRLAANLLDNILTDSMLIAPFRLSVQVNRAEARLAVGDVAGATADLDTATTILAQQRDSVYASELRSALLETGRRVFDRLAVLSLARHDTSGTLRYIERGRASFGGGTVDSTSGRREAIRARTGEVALDYALIGDTLLAWTVRGTRVHLVRQTVDGAALQSSIEEVRSLLERGIDSRRVNRLLAGLYDQLIRPVEGDLTDETPVALVVDGELAATPFEALYDSRRKRYMVQAHSIRHAGSLRDAALLPRPFRASNLPALLVSDPAFDSSSHELQRLRGARAEVDSITTMYPLHTVLSDTAATREAVLSAIPGARVVHIASHGMFDAQRPERSFLVLAADTNSVSSGTVTATELEEMDLEGVDLFVLSACETLRSRTGRADGFAGFAGALLNAGAGGVVGSLWRVDDALTAPLMTKFHSEWRRTGNGAESIRRAQLSMLGSGNAAYATPAAWAGFRYAGN